MRNKDKVLRGIQKIEGQIQGLISMRTRITADELYEKAEYIKDWLEEIKSCIEQEGLSAEEKNPYINR